MTGNIGSNVFMVSASQCVSSLHFQRYASYALFMIWSRELTGIQEFVALSGIGVTKNLRDLLPSSGSVKTSDSVPPAG